MLSMTDQERWLTADNARELSEDHGLRVVITKVVTNLLLFCLIFGLSATVNMKDFKNHLRYNKRSIITGITCQFLIMPFLGFLAVISFHHWGYTQALGISLLVVTASPGGSYSNWWCSLFNADLALSVAVTSISSILSVALLPANLFLYGWLAYNVILGKPNVNIVSSLDFSAIFISLAVVLGAIISGLSAGYLYDNYTFHRRANRFGSICGLLLIIFSGFLGSGGGGGNASVWHMEWSFYAGTALPCLIGIGLANFASRMLNVSKPETVTIAIETCYQNTAIATSVAVTMYSDPTQRALAISVPFFYGLVEAIFIGLYCIFAWRAGWTKAPANERLWKVITTTYEVEQKEEGQNTAEKSASQRIELESGDTDEDRETTRDDCSSDLENPISNDSEDVQS